MDARDEDTSVGATWYLIGEITSYEFMTGTLMFKGEEWGGSSGVMLATNRPPISSPGLTSECLGASWGWEGNSMCFCDPLIRSRRRSYPCHEFLTPQLAASNTITLHPDSTMLDPEQCPPLLPSHYPFSQLRLDPDRKQ